MMKDEKGKVQIFRIFQKQTSKNKQMKELYLWWNFICTLYLLVCQMGVTLGDSELCHFVCDMSCKC